MKKEKGASEELISAIKEILLQLDGDSLTFLKDQAEVLLYNKGVRERNAAAAEEKDDKAANKKSAVGEPAGRQAAVRFEQLKNGKFFNLCIGDARIFMDHSEIRSLLKIAIGAETEAAGAERLYVWFKRERKDVLVDGHIGSAGHAALPLIYRELLDTFEVG